MSAAAATSAPLTDEERVRRTMRLADYCLKNIAYYRAGRRLGRFRLEPNRQFWVTVSNNFLDTAILEWCKLFADRDGKHYWKETVTDHDKFMRGLLTRLRMTKAEYVGYIQAMECERDKFIAHLDDERTMRPPRLRAARISAAYLHDYLISDVTAGRWLIWVPTAREVYLTFYREATREYQTQREAPGAARPATVTEPLPKARAWRGWLWIAALAVLLAVYIMHLLWQ